MAGYAPRYSELGSNLALDLWSDVTTFRDAAVIIMSASLFHIALNEQVVGTEGRPFCVATSGLGVVLTGVTLFGCLALLLLRARVDWPGLVYRAPSGNAFQRPRSACCGHYSIELLFDLWGVVAGALLQKNSKPANFFSSVPFEGCSVYDSPPQLLAWTLGELLSFGAGVRVLFMLFAVSAHWPSFARSAFRALAVVGALGLAGLLVWVDDALINPWLVDVLGAYRNASLANTTAAASGELSEFAHEYLS